VDISLALGLSTHGRTEGVPTILVYHSGLILLFSGPKAYTILLRQKYIPAAIKAGPIVRHIICIKKPFSSH
jgi:hypothetical protein